MSINYNKYIDSGGTHYIANSGHDENNQYHGGQAGDQSGHEWELKAWYSRPWTVVLRYPDIKVGMEIARLSIAAALNPKIGYDQYQRTTYWKRLVEANYDPSAITVPCEEDCTAGTTANVKAAGHLLGIKALENIEIDTYSGNMRARFVAAGFKALTGSKYLSNPNYLCPGDVLLYEGHHAAVNITWGKYADRTMEPVGTQPNITLKLGDRILKNGMTGADVKQMQTNLIKLGYDCGKWGADGDFGDATEMAVRRFQTQEGLKVDGQFGPVSLAAMDKALERLNVTVDPKYVKIVGGNCYVRSDPSTDGDIRGIAHEGAHLAYVGETSSDGWLKILYKDAVGWVSGKYGRLID